MSGFCQTFHIQNVQGFYLNLVSPDGKNLLRSNKSINLPLYQHMTQTSCPFFFFFLKFEGLQLSPFILSCGHGCISERWTKISGHCCSQLMAAEVAENGDKNPRGSSCWAINPRVIRFCYHAIPGRFR